MISKAGAEYYFVRRTYLTDYAAFVTLQHSDLTCSRLSEADQKLAFELESESDAVGEKFLCRRQEKAFL
jgi:hypothetical protein